MEHREQHIIEERHTKLFLLAILLTNIIAMVNTSTVTISIPTYMSVFHVDINTVQWVVIGYLLPLGMMMPLSGYLCERYSYRKVFLIGVAALGICSLGCACSLNFYMLVLFRFLKGMAMGPALAGILLQAASWHVLFLFNVPLVLIVLWAGRRSIPQEAGCDAEKVDFLGVLQICLGTGLVMIAFSSGESWGWRSVSFWSCLGIGLALVAVFIVRQFHTSHPLLNFEVMKYKPFVLTLLVQCTLAMTMGINAILSQFYFQTGRGFSPAATGLFLMIPSVIMMGGNMLANTLHKRGWVRGLISGGMALALIGNLGLCNLDMDSNLLFVLVCYTLRFFGLATLQMPLTNYGLGSVPAELSGHASSMFNWGKQVVQVVSTNILTVLLSLNLNRYYLAAGNTGVPVEGTMAYRVAAIEAVNTDYLYLAVFLVISLCCTFLIRPQKEQ